MEKFARRDLNRQMRFTGPSKHGGKLIGLKDAVVMNIGSGKEFEFS